MTFQRPARELSQPFQQRVSRLLPYWTTIAPLESNRSS
jgi:hypothetical protein